jgi:hypothetical protein
MDSTLIATFVLGTVGIGITAYYSRHTKRLAHDEMLKELFTEFNNEYGKLHKKLAEVEEKHSTTEKLNTAPNAEELRHTIKLYFILCSEEFFWHYHKKRIDKKIWDSWQSGMLYWYSIPAIRDMWEAEVNESGKASYYITDEKEFFVRT